nr:hypothetical protein [Tanacetum cinerariifolium]
GNIGASNGGKSLAAIQELFEPSTLNVKVGITAAATVPFVMSFVNPTLKHEGSDYTNSVRPSIFSDSASPTTTEVDVAGLSQRAGTEASSGSFYVSQDMDPANLRQIYVPKCHVINDSALDDPEICRGMIDHLAPPGFFL